MQATNFAHLGILDGEQDEAVGIFLEKGLLGVAALQLGALVLGDDDGVDGVLGGRVVHVGVVGVGRAAGGEFSSSTDPSKESSEAEEAAEGETMGTWPTGRPFRTGDMAGPAVVLGLSPVVRADMADVRWLASSRKEQESARRGWAGMVGLGDYWNAMQYKRGASDGMPMQNSVARWLVARDVPF